MTAARDHSATGSLAYYFMHWRRMTEILSAGQEVYTELLNLCVWAKSNGGMGSFYRSAHELVFLFKSGTGSHRNNIQLGKFGGIERTSGTIQERIPSLAQILKATSWLSTPLQNPLR